MISRDDLRAAVGSGLLTEAQAASLSALADSRRGAREDLAPGDEPFELFKGFNEIFIVIGLVILAMGWIAVNTASMFTEIVNYRTQATTAALFGAAILWGLSEYFIRRRRMVARCNTRELSFGASPTRAIGSTSCFPDKGRATLEPKLSLKIFGFCTFVYHGRTCAFKKGQE